MTRKANKTLAPTPSWDDIADNETVIAINGPMDELGRVHLVGFWRSAYGPGTPTFHNPFVGVRAQVFFTNLEGFIANAARQGHTVRGLDDQSDIMVGFARPPKTDTTSMDG